MMVAAARKYAHCSRNNPHVLNVTSANHNAAYTGLRLVIISTAQTSAADAKIQNRIESASGPVATCSFEANSPQPTAVRIHPPARDRGHDDGISHHTPSPVRASEMKR